MAELTAKPNTIIVDPAAAFQAGQSKIEYKKHPSEALIARYPGQTWEELNPFFLVGTADADEIGTFNIQLSPGELFEAGITDGAIPGEEALPTSIPNYIRVACVRKNTEATPFITDNTGEAGGTWIAARIASSVFSRVVVAEVGLEPPVVGANGLPFIQSPVGNLVKYGVSADGQLHDFEFSSLLPGTPHFLLVILMDNQGRWDTRTVEIVTKRRKLTVKFPEIVVFNDGDWATTGEAQFTFSVGFVVNRNFTAFETFNWSHNDLDDWSETGRPYALGFVHLGTPQVVQIPTEVVWLQSTASEDDSTETDRAGGRKRLFFPGGRNNETVTNDPVSFKCSPSEGDLEYDVKAVVTVEYVT